ncbi:hypothetical protein BXT84_11940 [Sulfobacillus thermotolerans]|uniref:Cobyrinate a,c-diamide synthase n=1 Tax=Sulfobacillus thermotolerans TaxID=338644 RepID=A0ABM6RTC4_9FIRM|nr:hypothetical protein BXT84_11940 [Sulfobacillus thermotolerans]
MNQRLDGAYPRLVIAAPRSGEGKTTVTLAVMAGLHSVGQSVQGFKVGPDYIDPSYYYAASQRAGRNLDAWMGGPHDVQASFIKGMAQADVGVIEGVMGYFDGKNPVTREASTWHIASLLQAPVLFVVDGQRSAASLAAIVWGFQNMVEPSYLAGVVINRVNSERHYRLLQDAIEHYTGLSCVGYLPADDQVAIAERALGIEPAHENVQTQALIDRLTFLASQTLDMDQILRIARHAPRLSGIVAPVQRPAAASKVIAVAQDQAFNFYYPQNLELLVELGAKLVPFSPLAGDDIPIEADALYIGGGFPERYVERLSAQTTLLRRYRERISSGLPTIAECGGYMFLSESLRGTDGQDYPMVGVIPHKTAMQPRLQAVGYRTITLLESSHFGPGVAFRGHEFHYSRTVQQQGPAAYRLEGRGGTEESGYAQGALLAGYAHFYFPSNVSAMGWWMNHLKARQSP